MISKDENIIIDSIDIVDIINNRLYELLSLIFGVDLEKEIFEYLNKKKINNNEKKDLLECLKRINYMKEQFSSNDLISMINVLNDLLIIEGVLSSYLFKYNIVREDDSIIFEHMKRCKNMLNNLYNNHSNQKKC